MPLRFLSAFWSKILSRLKSRVSRDSRASPTKSHHHQRSTTTIPPAMEYFEHIQDVIGQLPILKSYTHILLGFPLAEEKREIVIESLNSAARQLITDIPFLAGKVVNEGAGPGNSGVFRVARHQPWESPEHSIVRVEDRSEALASYSTMLEADGPANMLPGPLLGPRTAFPQSYEETEDDPAPVLEIQANFVKGGLLLDIAAQHNIVDAIGMFQIANLLSILMRGESIHQLYLDEANRDRRYHLIPLLGPDEPLLDHSELRAPILKIPPIPQLLAAFKWHIWRFNNEDVAMIKALANSKPEDFVEGITSVSVNDAMTAFLWQRLTATRLKRSNNPNAISKISRAVDLRRVMEVSAAYLGHMVRVANIRLTFRDIVESSLSRIASILRRKVDEVNTQYATRSYATYLANEPDKSTIAYGGSFNPENDLSCSSVAHVSIPTFGPLGKPEMLRRPTYSPLLNSAYLGVEARGHCWGGIMCLHEDEIAALREDEEWSKHVGYVG